MKQIIVIGVLTGIVLVDLVVKIFSGFEFIPELLRLMMFLCMVEIIRKTY